MFDTPVWWMIGIPALFGLGWVAARIDLRQGWREGRSLPNAYFRGLNFLLNDQHDRAIDAFIEVVKLDPETIELHFALGGLFRRRGESDRAIRIHQNLLNRADMPASYREQALYDLGQDYLKAGMLDRAEDAFTALENTRFADEALQHRLRLYELVKDWTKAIEAASPLSQSDGQRTHLTHYLCERAEEALQSGNLAAAKEDVRRALARDAADVRALLLSGRLAFETGDMREAIGSWRAVAQRSPEYIGLVATSWIGAHASIGQLDQGLEALKQWYQETRSLDMLDALFTAIREHKGTEAAIDMVRDALAQAPSLLGLDRLLQARLAQVDVSERDDLALIQHQIHHHTQRLARYRCAACGFKAKRFYWQCPGCNAWGSYPARRMEELVEG